MKKNVIKTLIGLAVIIGICSCTTTPKKQRKKPKGNGLNMKIIRYWEAESWVQCLTFAY